jgi:predicted DNA-binding protein
MAQQPLDPRGGESRPIRVRLPADTRQAVIELTAGRGQTVSEFVRGAIEHELEQDTGPP